MLPRLCRAFIDAVGPEKALADAETRLAAAMGSLAALGATGALAGHSVPYWFTEARRRVADVLECHVRVAMLQGIADGDEPDEWVLDPAARDRQVVEMAIEADGGEPRILNRVLVALSPRTQPPARLKQIDDQVVALGKAYEAGDGVDQANFEARLRRDLLERDKLAVALASATAAVQAIQTHLREHAPQVIKPVSAVKEGLHDCRAIRERKSLEGDPELARLGVELAEVESEVSALGFGGRAVGMLGKGAELGERSELDQGADRGPQDRVDGSDRQGRGVRGHRRRRRRSGRARSCRPGRQARARVVPGRLVGQVVATSDRRTCHGRHTGGRRLGDRLTHERK